MPTSSRAATDFNSIGLRYFNVFGPRQDPGRRLRRGDSEMDRAMIATGDVYINGDGETSRDFCYVANAVQANLLAARAGLGGADVFNVAVHARTSLNELFTLLREGLAREGHAYQRSPVHRDFRAGDVRHSQADISKAVRLLRYAPEYSIRDGLAQAMPWYLRFLKGCG